MIREVWENKVQKELKTTESKIFTDPIEGISWEYKNNNPTEHFVDFKRFGSTRNPWKLASYHVVENAKKSNQEILNDLNFGSEVLMVTWENCQTDLDVLFEGVAFQYIQTFVEADSEEAQEALKQWIEKRNPSNFKILTNPNAHTTESMSSTLKLDGFDGYSAGANGQTEISWMLHQFEVLLRQNSTDSVLFEIGIGENTFMEIAKFKSLQVLIECLKVKYDKPNFNTLLCAKTGWRNKSLKDVNTNQLRHTNEALVAILSGVDMLCITPYDFQNITGPSEFSRRMAMNVSNLLKEEAHLDLYDQITEGSYIIDYLTQQMCDLVWDKLDRLASLEKPEDQVIEWIQETVTKRTLGLDNNDTKMIGINCFLSDSNDVPTRKSPHSKLGIPYYFYENIAL